MENQKRKTNYRLIICAMLFLATMVNYLDRQVLSLLVPDNTVYVNGVKEVLHKGMQAEFGWSEAQYGLIAGAFSLMYAICMIGAGRSIDICGTKRGYLWALGIWSTGAIIHAFSSIATAGIVDRSWIFDFDKSREILAVLTTTADKAALVASTSVGFFIFARGVLALGEAGNFPAAIKATAEYFPQRDRAFATSIFNSGSTVGAMLAPVCIIPLGIKFGWEWAFILIGALGFIWMGIWVFVYKKPKEWKGKRINQAEWDYIQSDGQEEVQEKEKIPFREFFRQKATWSFAVGKFLSDAVWFFMLFFIPKYLETVFHLGSRQQIWPLTVLYFIVMISLFGGKLPTIIIDKTGKKPYEAHMQSMLIFAFFPLLLLIAQPMGQFSYWWTVILLGVAGAAHQSWSANIFATVGTMFPKRAMATITGIGGMAGGIASFFMLVGCGIFQDYAEKVNLPFCGFEGKAASYYIVFCVCAFAYLIGWLIMKSLVPKYKLVEIGSIKN